jgi:hypothetical protein
MTIEHKNITDAELHEPLGVVSAAVNKVYVADGAGSGAWKLSPVGVDVATEGAVFVATGAGTGTWKYPASYGHLYAVDSDGETMSGIGVTAKKFTGFATVGPQANVVGSVGTHDITVTYAGYYKIDLAVSFSTSAVGDAGLYAFHVQVGAFDGEIGFHEAMSGSSDTNSGFATGIIYLDASDVIDVDVSSDAAGDDDDIAINNASLTMVRVDQ